MERVTRYRLRGMCRRGPLELDLALERNPLRHGSNLGDLELVLLHELLDHDCMEFREIVCRCGDRDDPRQASLVERLRAG